MLACLGTKHCVSLCFGWAGPGVDAWDSSTCRLAPGTMWVVCPYKLVCLLWPHCLECIECLPYDMQGLGSHTIRVQGRQPPSLVPGGLICLGPKTLLTKPCCHHVVSIINNTLIHDVGQELPLAALGSMALLPLCPPRRRTPMQAPCPSPP